MKVILGSDHAGYELKEYLKKVLQENGISYEDVGPHEYVKTDDYPDYCIKAAEIVAADLDDNLGIVLGYSGQGEAFSANKVKGIRAVVYYGSQPEIIKLSRVHNNANVLSLGAGFLKKEDAKAAILEWLKTEFTHEERHERRIKKVMEYESS